jgi:hypothetical protein
MGQSAPTVTDAFDTFQVRYAAFRAELEPAEQAWFDELVCAARRHSNAINRRPHLDFERPVMLAMLMEAMRRLGESEAQATQLRAGLEEVQLALRDAGLAVRRLPAPPALGLGGVGQTRIHDHEALRAVPA